MIKSLRWRLQLWYAIILLAVIACFGVAFYRELHRSTFGEIDGELLSGARVLEGTLRALPRVNADGSTTNDAGERSALADVPLALPPLRQGRRPLGPPRPEPPQNSGSIIDEDGVGFRGGPFPPRDAPPYFSIFSAEGTLLRADANDVDVVFAKPRYAVDFRSTGNRREVLLRGPEGSLIVVGRDVERMLGRLTDSLWQLVAIGGGVLTIGLMGGWWLAGKAIEPIARISDTAEQITANHLGQRIDTTSMDSELQSLASVLNTMLAGLERSFTQQSQFTADASHELRTPIAVLLSHAELALSRNRSNEDYRKTIGTCQKAALRMKDLVDGLLLLARADAGKLEMQTAQVDLHSVASEAIELLSQMARERDVNLTLEGESAICLADAARISQVVINLVHNAIHHNPAGSSVVLTVEAGERFSTLQVTDNGCGIERAMLPNIFDRFYRAEASRNRVGGTASGGSGLGLSICKSIVDAHAGRLTVTSEVGVGSTFQLSLPR